MRVFSGLQPPILIGTVVHIERSQNPTKNQFCVIYMVLTDTPRHCHSPHVSINSCHSSIPTNISSSVKIVVGVSVRIL